MASQTSSWMIAAGLVSLLTAFTHLFAGGRFIARPLLQSSLSRTVRATHYFCWHMVTLLLFAMAAAFGLAASAQQHHPLAFAATSLAAAFFVLNATWLTAWRVGPLRMPQWAFFLMITVLGIGALAQ